MTIDLSKYEFVDFGCSDGGSMGFAERNFKTKNGIGIDIDPRKVEITRALGYQAEVADLTKPLSFSGKARFSILSHILEHIPSALMAAQILNTAATISSEYVFVRQPWFDCDGPLAQMNLKLYWSDWHGHTNHITSLQMYLVLRRQLEKGLISGFPIWGHSSIRDTSHESIVPLDSPTDRRRYDPQTDTPKEHADLGFDCFKELVAYIGVAPDFEINTLPAPFGGAKMLFSRKRSVI